MNLRETEQTYALDLFPRRNVTIVRGDGATLWDDTGRTYIDCVAGFGVASIGHANPEVAEAIGIYALVTAILAMTRSLGLQTVAEGIETEQQAVLVRDRGCDEIQGYLISPAVPAEEFEHFLRQRKRD